MRCEVLLDAGRVAALLRQHRSGHAAQGQQEEQDQRDPHRGELPPRPLQPVGGAERGPGRGRAGARMVVLFGRRVEGICFRCAHIGHRLIPPSAVTFARIAVSPGYVTVPKTAPAMCPVRSTTSVVGVPAIGTLAVKSSVMAELWSLTLG